MVFIHKVESPDQLFFQFIVLIQHTAFRRPRNRHVLQAIECLSHISGMHLCVCSRPCYIAHIEITPEIGSGSVIALNHGAPVLSGLLIQTCYVRHHSLISSIQGAA